jgi:hypothetical protein
MLAPNRPRIGVVMPSSRSPAGIARPSGALRTHSGNALVMISRRRCDILMSGTETAIVTGTALSDGAPFLGQRMVPNRVSGVHLRADRRITRAESEMCGLGPPGTMTASSAWSGERPGWHATRRRGSAARRANGPPRGPCRRPPVIRRRRSPGAAWVRGPRPSDGPRRAVGHAGQGRRRA